MDNLYTIIADLCEQHKISVYKMCKDINIRGSVISDLKNGRKKGLNADTVAKIANYFGVATDSLIGIKQKEAPVLNKKDERDIAKELEKIRQSLENAAGLMFDGDPMSEEARESILAAMKLGLEVAKTKNKEKYTPKKYKKE